MKKKILIVFSLLLLIGVITTGILSSSFQEMIYIQSLEDKLNSNSLLIKELFEKEKVQNNDLNILAKDYSKIVHARVTFLDEKGNIVGDSIDKGKEKSIKGLVSVNIPVQNKNIKVSSLNLSINSNDMDKFNKKIANYLLISIFIGFVIAFLLGIRYIKYASKPYKELVEATKNISDGNYAGKVYFQEKDEIGVLANNFNEMGFRLNSTIEELQASNTKLKATLTSVVDGLIALDNDLKFILFNPAVEEIFGIEGKKVMGQSIYNVFSKDEIYEIFEGPVGNNMTWNKEVELYEPEYKVLKIYANPIILNSDPNRKLGMVYLFQDVTKVKKLEKMRKDFVANVSHELKTPLTSIKGFIETLKSGAVEDKKNSYKFLDIIDVEVDRLNCLVDDLLLLSEIENKNSNIVYEYFNVEEVVEDLFQILDKIAKKKNIILEKEIQKEIPEVYGNYNYFRQLLINLIDNGIKYTPSGGEVNVLVFTKEKNLVVKVMDTGIGIAESHQKRLFERFYRVDKSRTRQVGGTGLGLAIVKHIVLMFNGTLDLESKPKEGSVFTIEIPLDKSRLNTKDF